MESPQSVASTFNGETRANKPLMSSDNSIGVLEVFVHQARDIHNICIYHKQDVYAKLCLTSNPKNSLSTKIINGGGRNPVFDDTLHFDVQNLDCSLKCEIFMMSRVKNYLEDQLLGFTLVPLSEVIVRNGKLEKEFSLSSTDLFHSPAGFVELSLSYTGDSPELMHIPAVPTEDETKLAAHIEFDESEFLDPKIVCENNQMVSNYFATPCSDSDEFVSSETGFLETDSVHSAAADTVEEAAPTNDILKNGISSPSVAVSSGSSGIQNDSKLSSEVNNNSGLDRDAKKPTDIHDDSKVSSEENNSRSDREANKPTDIIKNGDLDKTNGDAVAKPILTVNIEPEQKVVQQDIVDMYTKSLQQFTESLAKMKLPLDIDSPTQSENSSSSQQTPKSASSRVFYGSRAFF